MGPKDLLTALDLDGRLPDAADPTGVLAESVPAADTTPDVSPTALAVDAWGLRRGRELVAESERLKRAGTDEHAAADFFTAAFDPDPVLVEVCTDAKRHHFVRHLLGTPAYRSLHAATRLDDTAAGIAAAHFADQFTRLESDAPAGGATPEAEGLVVHPS
jgi:hypothetical protein